MRWGWIAILFCAVLVSDQAVKTVVTNNLIVGDPWTIIPGFFDLHLIYNPGAAFGLFAGLSDTVRRIVLGAVSLVAICVVGRLLWTSRDDLTSQLGVAAILGGAFGNIIDRVRYDSVVDFLDFYAGDYHWPAFNIADSAIVIAVGLFLWSSWRSDRAA